MPHIHEKIDFTVQLWIVYEDKVLLRFHEKYHEWLGVGGHIELDEDPLQAAHREALEEVGLQVTIPNDPVARDGDHVYLPSPAFMDRHRISPTHEHIGLQYFAKATTHQLVIPDTHEKAECRWCTQDEVLALNLSVHAKKYALAALEALGSKPI
jgi:8-oxo-dGTP pyrophosphatase MutT (NUDIX family)